MFGFMKSQQNRLQDALNNIENGNIKAGMDKLFALARKDNAEAAYWLGDIYEFGIENLQEAARWYGRAADNGHVKAQWCLANMYMTGRGATLNPKEAMRLYHSAAENGIPEAQFVLGESYRTGQHVALAPKKALLWYQKSAQAGYPPAAQRIAQFWPDGNFQEKHPASRNEYPDKRSTSGAIASTNQYVMRLQDMIIKAAHEQGYLPNGEIPFVPELQQHQQQVVGLICSSINAAMKKGIDEVQMIAVFRFVFLSGFDAMYQWHKSSNGRIDRPISVGNSFQDEQFLQLPSEIKAKIKTIQAPELFYGIMADWWQSSSNELRQADIDIWPPLTTALSLTFGIAVSIALKMFGYRE